MAGVANARFGEGAVLTARGGIWQIPEEFSALINLRKLDCRANAIRAIPRGAPQARAACHTRLAPAVAPAWPAGALT